MVLSLEGHSGSRLPLSFNLIMGVYIMDDCHHYLDY